MLLLSDVLGMDQDMDMGTDDAASSRQRGHVFRDIIIVNPVIPPQVANMDSLYSLA